MDRITLSGIRVWGRHGADIGERDRAQPFVIEVRAEIDLRAAQTSDDLTDTLDYAALHERIVAIVAGTSYALLERLAGELLETIFDDARVAAAEVSIAKPDILRGATPAVTLVRSNPRHRVP